MKFDYVLVRRYIGVLDAFIWRLREAKVFLRRLTTFLQYFICLQAKYETLHLFSISFILAECERRQNFNLKYTPQIAQ